MHCALFITGLSSVEAYNIKSNEWFHVAPMNTRRSSVGVGVVGGAGNPLVVKGVSSSNPDPSFLNGQANDCFKKGNIQWLL